MGLLQGSHRQWDSTGGGDNEEGSGKKEEEAAGFWVGRRFEFGGCGGWAEV